MAKQARRKAQQRKVDSRNGERWDIQRPLVHNAQTWVVSRRVIK